MASSLEYLATFFDASSYEEATESIFWSISSFSLFICISYRARSDFERVSVSSVSLDAMVLYSSDVSTSDEAASDSLSTASELPDTAIRSPPRTPTTAPTGPPMPATAAPHATSDVASLWAVSSHELNHFTASDAIPTMDVAAGMRESPNSAFRSSSLWLSPCVLLAKLSLVSAASPSV